MEKASNDVFPVSEIEAKEVIASSRDGRKYLRVKVSFRVAFRVIEMHREDMKLPESDNYSDYDGVTQNLSAGGICFETIESLFKGDILELKIELMPNTPRIQCIGRVLRVSQAGEELKERDNNKKPKEAAVSFLAIHSKDRLRLENHCKEFSD